MAAPATQTGKRERHELRILLVCVLCVHLLFAWASRHGIVRDDADSYVVLGHNLSNGLGYVFSPGNPPTAWRAPGYPVLLALIFRISGGSLQAARGVNALLWTLTAGLSYGLALQLYAGLLPKKSERVRHGAALTVAGVVGLYPEFVGHTGLLWSDSLMIAQFVGAVSALIAFGRKPSPGRAVAAGALIGLCILTRSTVVILIPAIWFCLQRFQPRRTPWGLALAASIIAVSILGCWTVRNRLVTGKVILVESNIGYNLYVGNRPDTPIPFAWKEAEKLPHDPLYQRLNSAPTEAERSAGLTRAAMAEIRAHPMGAVLRGCGKTIDFWLPDFFIAFNMRSGALGPAFVPLWKPFLALTVLIYLIVLPCAISFAWKTRACPETQVLLFIVLLYMLPHTLVYGASRYHLPLMPLLLCFAAPIFRNGFVSVREYFARTSNSTRSNERLHV